MADNGCCQLAGGDLEQSSSSGDAQSPLKFTITKRLGNVLARWSMHKRAWIALVLFLPYLKKATWGVAATSDFLKHGFY